MKPEGEQTHPQLSLYHPPLPHLLLPNPPLPNLPLPNLPHPGCPHQHHQLISLLPLLKPGEDDEVGQNSENDTNPPKWQCLGPEKQVQTQGPGDIEPPQAENNMGAGSQAKVKRNQVEKKRCTKEGAAIGS